MTSKISYSKLIKQDIRHRGWLAALSWVLMLLCITVTTMLLLEASIAPDAPDWTEQLKEIRNTFPAMLNGSFDMFPLVAIILLGVLAAVTGFSYLHSKEKTDFYHSLPLPRQQLFAISYLSGLLIFVVPYLAAGMLTILAGSVYGIMTASVLGKSLLALLGGILGFLVIYHLTIFAMMLTGKVVTGILAAATLFVYGSMAGVLTRSLTTYFFSTYHSQSLGFLDKLYGFRSPLEIFGQILGSTTWYDSQYDTNSFSYFSYYTLRFLRISDSGFRSRPVVLALTVVFLVLLLALSVLLYKKRPSEAAGNALAYPRTAPFIKVMISIPTALFLGLLIGSMYDNGTKWVILISILSVILLCALIEFIYHMDLRQLFAGKYSSILSFLTVAGILCILHFDVFGYDTWLPKESSLESMALDTSQIYGYFCYPNTVTYNVDHPSSPDLLNDEDCQIQDFSAIYELAQEGIEKQQQTGIDEQINQDAEGSVNISVRYNKKSGRSVYRNYVVSIEHALDTLAALCQKESYRKKLFPIFYVAYDTVSGVRLTDIYQTPVLMDLTRSEQDALFDAYKQDVMNVDIRDLQYKDPVGELSIDLPEAMQPGAQVYDSGYNITLPNFYLYENYENSLALLEKYGYTIRRKIDPEDVSQIILHEKEDSETIDAGNMVWSDESSESILTDPDEIKEIVSQVRYTAVPFLGYEKNFSRSADIVFKKELETVYYVLE